MRYFGFLLALTGPRYEVDASNNILNNDEGLIPEIDINRAGENLADSMGEPLEPDNVEVSRIYLNTLTTLQAKAQSAMAQGPPRTVAGVHWEAVVSVRDSMSPPASQVTLQECGIANGASISVSGLGDNLDISRSEGGGLFVTGDIGELFFIHAHYSRLEERLAGILGDRLIAERPRLVHDDERCRETVWFQSRIQGQSRVSDFMQGRSSVEVSTLIGFVPLYLYMMQFAHSAGVLINTEGLYVLARVGKFGFWHGDTPWRMFVDPETRAHANPADCRSFDTCLTRASDFAQLLAVLKSVEAGAFLPTWNALVGRFERYITDELGWYDEPDYNRWLYEFSQDFPIVTVGDYIESLLQDPGKREGDWLELSPEWIRASVNHATRGLDEGWSPDYMWDLSKGREAMELVKLVDGHKQDVILQYIAEASSSALPFASNIEAGKWMHRTFAEWNSDFCEREAERIFASFVSIGEYRTFKWVICPNQWTTERYGLLRRETESGSWHGPQIPTEEEVAEFWTLLNLQDLERRSEYARELGYAFIVTSKLLNQLQLPVADICRYAQGHLPGFEYLCNQNNAREYIRADHGLLNMAWVCGWTSPADLCSLVAEPETRYVGVNKEVPPEVAWQAAGLPELIWLMDLPEVSVKCKSDIVYIAEARAKSIFLLYSSAGSGRLSQSIGLTGFQRVCQEIDNLGYPSLTLLWMCRNPAQAICRVLEGQSEQRVMEVRYQLTGLDVAEFAEEINLTHLMTLSSTVPAACQRNLVNYLLDLVESHEKPANVAALLQDKEVFCAQPLDEMLTRESLPRRRISRLICVDLPPINNRLNLEDVRSLIVSTSAKLGNGVLIIRRPLAFTDSLEMLVDPFVALDRPRGVRYAGEPGADAGGITRDWFSQVSKIAAGLCSMEGGQDMGASLFVMHKRADDEGYLRINPEKSKPEFEKYWRAFGRLMALAIIREEQLGIPLPVYFFAAFLNREGQISLDDLLPEEAEQAHNLRLVLRENYPDRGMYVMFREFGFNEPRMTNRNKAMYIQRALKAFVPNYTKAPLAWMREGFEHVLNLDDAREKLYPAHRMKLLISGADELDVDSLKRAARRDHVSEQRFDWLFEWLAEQADRPDIQRQFMLFATGTATLSVKPLLIQAAPASQGRMAKAHTCTNAIELPAYTSKQELAEAMMESIHASGFAFA